MSKTTDRKPKMSDCIFTAHSFSAGEEGEDGRVKIKMLARTNDSLSHWYWGECVHDFDSMQHRETIPIDYEHGDPIGFLDSFKADKEGLHVEGYLTPVTQIAKDALAMMKSGIPMQASIFFGSDKMGYEEVADGAKRIVNGKEFVGPVTIFRDWQLRGVALCPYGYDSKTKSELFSAQDAELNLTCLTEKEDGEMSEKNVENTPVTEKDDGNVASTPAVDLRAEFKVMVEKFGQEKAAAYFAEGLDMGAATEKFAAEVAAENKALTEKIAELSKKPEPLKLAADGVDESDAPAVEKNGGKKKLTDEEVAAYAAEHSMRLSDAEFVMLNDIPNLPAGR